MLPWVATLFLTAGQPLCMGVRLSPRSVLIPSSCSKQLQPGKQLLLALGQAASVDQQSRGVVEHVTTYPGPLDVSLVVLTARKDLPLERDFPCILGQEGSVSARGPGYHGVVSLQAANIKRLGKTKLRAFPARSDSTQCAESRVCFSIGNRKFRTERFSRMPSPVFLKVGKSKWALSGFTASSSDGKLEVEPLYQTADWIRREV